MPGQPEPKYQCRPKRNPNRQTGTKMEMPALPEPKKAKWNQIGNACITVTQKVKARPTGTQMSQEKIISPKRIRTHPPRHTKFLPTTVTRDPENTKNSSSSRCIRNHRRIAQSRDRAQKKAQILVECPCRLRFLPNSRYHRKI